jgi:glycosyltransferase involved in cell wall biosynthesis
VTKLTVCLLTQGDPDTMTGGYLYHRRVADRAAGFDARIDFLSAPTWRFPLPALAGPALMRTVARRRPDVLLVDSIAAAFVGPWLPRRGFPPLAAILHQPPGGIDHGGVRRRVQSLLDRRTYRRATRMLVASEDLGDTMRRSGVPADRLRVVPPGRDPAASVVAPDRDLRAGRRAAVLSVGNWMERKGLLDLLDAVARLPADAATLHLVGDTTVEPHYTARVEARLAAPDLTGRVVVHGRRTPAEVAGLYRAADVFALASVREPYGTVYGEAMAAGLPVVGWAAGNLPHLARDGVEGLAVPPGDRAALAGALRQFTADDAGGSGCGNPLRLALAVAPELVPAAQATAADWVRGDVTIGGRCVAVDVTGAESADVAAAIAGRANVAVPGLAGNQQVKVPNVWIPDSSTWLQRLRTAGPNLVPNEAPAIASSPVVLAMPQPIAANLGWPTAKLTWIDVLKRMTTGTGLRAGIVEPTRDAAGLAGLVSISVAANTAGGVNGQQATAAAMRGLVVGRSAVRDDLLQRFPRSADQAALATGIAAAPLSEQSVNGYNKKSPGVPLASLYLDPAPPALDYPFTVVPGGDADRTTAAQRLRAAFTGDKYRDRLAAAGLRAADGSTGKGFPEAPGAPAGGGQGGAATELALVDRVLTTWAAMTAPARTLAVLDVSGSMNRLVPTAGNATRMAVLLDAAKRGLSLFDDTWAIGVWTFSTELAGPGTSDYREVVPIGPLSTNRQQVLGALGGITATKLGDTGLYDTVLAGYKALQTGWEPGMVNTLIVMTDGENDDANGLSQEQLLNELGKIKDAKKPVRVILIAFGPDVAPDGLRPITNLTSGGVFAASDPAKISEVFLQAVTTR